MLVKELIEKLSKLDQEALVIMHNISQQKSTYLCGVDEDEAIETEDYDIDYLSRYTDPKDMENIYEDSLAFFSCAVLY